ncbi:hypothetical protein Tco_1325379 [Tanacetum coccineum]
MESLFSNSKEREFQHLQERLTKTRKDCSLYFELIKKHLKYLQTIRWDGWGAEEGFNRAIQRYFSDNCDTFRKKLSYNINNLQRQIEKEYLHESESRKCFTVLKTQFETFFTSKQVDSLNREDQVEDRILKESIQKYTGKELQTYRRELIYYMDALEMNIGRRALHESECLMKAREVRAIKEIEKRLNESKMQTQEGVAGSSSSVYDSNAERAQVDKVVSDVKNAIVGPSNDNDTFTEVHHLNHDTFENVFALGIQNHEKKVENCTKVDHEAQQANDSLTKELEIYKDK